MRSPSSLTATGITAFAAFAGVTVVHLVAQLVDPDSLVTDATQWLLMPLLALGLAASTEPRRDRLVKLILLALAFSWLGDAAPDLFDGDAAFLVLIGFFLCAQITYIAAFLPYRDRSVLHTKRWVLALYAVAVVVLVAVCAPGAGALAVAVVIYGLCIATMAVLATGVSRAVAWGAVVFVISDSLIALNAFVDGFSLPATGFWIMITYICAQALITGGVLSRSGTAHDSGDRAGSADRTADAG
ncbi:lysoplasmalogenase [Rhodococcus coprophilus]|uniref:Hypothetical membrane protein n=1 Tax=Rhodococcus coprophilus TaxID=38310 RepID=A0A2X4TPF0_9NOCA|nr:lysoplasmalogenase [Rhodococcus coprophilus]MBM7460981.1 putative membrane protein YhhN [Rhodococcus coprophilus]SQI28783.1 hypothetical membrane protein [Rhodococcus coprophilus]